MAIVESDDEGLIDWIKRLKTERKQSASAQNGNFFFYFFSWSVCHKLQILEVIF